MTGNLHIVPSVNLFISMRSVHSLKDTMVVCSISLFFIVSGFVNIWWYQNGIIRNLINDSIIRCMHLDGINGNVEESRDIILYNSQAPFPVIPQLWYTPQPFTPYYFTSPSLPQCSPFIPYLPYYSNAAVS